MNDVLPEPSADETAFLERLLRWQDGALPPQEQAAFERELAESPEKRRAFIAAHLRGASVREHLRAEAYRGPEPQTAKVSSLVPVGWRRWRTALPWALAACLALMLYFWLERRPAPAPAPTGPVTWIATLVGQSDCEWADGAARLTGQRLSAGTLRLRRGTAVVRFDAGARMVVVGPAAFSLESPGSARLVAGQVWCRHRRRRWASGSSPRTARRWTWARSVVAASAWWCCVQGADPAPQSAAFRTVAVDDGGRCAPSVERALLDLRADRTRRSDAGRVIVETELEVHLVVNVAFESAVKAQQFEMPDVTLITRFDKYADIFIPANQRGEEILTALKTKPQLGVDWFEVATPVEQPPLPPTVGEEASPRNIPEEIVRGGDVDWS